MSFDEQLLDSLLECSIEENCNMEIDNSLQNSKVIETKPIYRFNCIEDNDTLYPDTIFRKRYKGYKPPKAPKIKFINPFEKKIENPVYSKQLHDSMSRIELRKADKHDTKIKYLKKKGYM